MKNLLIVCAASALLSACSSPDEAMRALSVAGYKNVTTTGYAWFGCDEKDTFHTGFTAVGPNGQAVSGVVRSGFLKGATIRTN